MVCIGSHWFPPVGVGIASWLPNRLCPSFLFWYWWAGNGWGSEHQTMLGTTRIWSTAQGSWGSADQESEICFLFHLGKRDFDASRTWKHLSLSHTHTHTHTHTNTVFLERKTKAFHLVLWLQASSVSHQLCDSELISHYLWTSVTSTPGWELKKKK